MKKIAALSILVFFSSCRFFDGQVPNEEELLQKRLKEINWKEVSSYPTIAECDAIIDKQMKKDCFFAQMVLLIQQKLDLDTIGLLYPEMDTIQFKVTVFSNSSLKFEPQIPIDGADLTRIKVDSIIRARLVDFPKIEPAQKEGVPVTTQFLLPVIIDMTK
ncbi:hypothetical protein R1T16_13055 [Flavobacterium sp. DG1-102-2]|uniref:hypothetical protein n=1 Tax=Flavobacterium sp. DG1-102-2 TaxID=3081663 RepID=UPI002949309C|nr:hypothetical protein [Flavobacterium sp. DG1-102-2]MDV6169357.1 hypothetical protein [Flavobacterium sp. DG1-102-2]